MVPRSPARRASAASSASQAAGMRSSWLVSSVADRGAIGAGALPAVADRQPVVDAAVAGPRGAVERAVVIARVAGDAEIAVTVTVGVDDVQHLHAVGHVAGGRAHGAG